MKNEEALDTIRSMLKCDNVNVENLITKKESMLYIISGHLKKDDDNNNDNYTNYSNDNNCIINKNKICIKFYFDLEKNSVSNEYSNLGIFHALTKGQLISAPKPLAFDSDKGAIAYEFVEGSSLKDFLFSSGNDKDGFEDVLKLTAEALSEFHRIFEVKEDAGIDPKDQSQIGNLFRNCSLKKFVRPFLDFKPENIIITSSEDKDMKNNISLNRISLIDFPNKYDFHEKGFLALPHRDLAYFLYHMMRIGGYPQFSISKKYGWDDKKIIKLFLNAYFESCPIEGKDEDIYIVNYFLNYYASQWATAPIRYIIGTNDKLRSLCLKYYSFRLINIVIKAFNLPETSPFDLVK